MKVTSKQLAQTLFSLTDGKAKSEVEKAVADFAGYLHKERKLKLEEKIVEQFSKIYNRQKGIIEAEVTTAEKISAGLEKKMKDYIGKKYNAKEVVLKNIIDENIKGGIIIKVGDEVVDGSVRGKIEALGKLLVAK